VPQGIELLAKHACRSILKMEDPVPLEISDPELAEHFRLVANGIHPVIRGMSLQSSGNVYILRNGSIVRHRTPRPSRNDPCPCGSGKKFKKCCILRT
jgi:hypothetical protein